MSGFVALHRAAVDHPLFAGDSSRLGAWLWLVTKACWRPTKYDLHGKIITLDRGQFVASRSQLAKAWGWKESAVERFLTRLQTEQMIRRETGQGRSIITICNYAKYQDMEQDAGQETGQDIGQRPDSHRTAKEQGNNTSEPKGSSEDVARPREPGLPLGDEGEPKSSNAKTKPHRIPDNWEPSPLPENVRTLADLWPPGRLERELDQFKDYWSARVKNSAYSDWNKVWHNRIRDQHDRVIRENRNGTGNRNAPGFGAGFGRPRNRAEEMDDARSELGFNRGYG